MRQVLWVRQIGLAKPRPSLSPAPAGSGPPVSRLLAKERLGTVTKMHEWLREAPPLAVTWSLVTLDVSQCESFACEVAVTCGLQQRGTAGLSQRLSQVH